jgi:NACHT domain
MSTPPDTQLASKRKRKKKILLIGIITLSVIAATCLGLLGEVMPDGIQSQLKGYFNQKQNIWITVVILLTLTGILTTYWLTDKADKTENAPAELTDEERQRFIKLLQNRYALRLAQKTGERFALKLELRYTLNGIQQTERLDIAARQPGRPIGGLANLVKRHRYLLLMGQPGAGKTTLLLSTAEELLQHTMADKEAPIPVIFNLASWGETESSFDGWMAKILIHGYGYPPVSASEALNSGKLLLLLDGLDEVGNHLANEVDKKMLRQSCLLAIQQYQVQRSSPSGIIICTRIDEYLSAGGNAPVYAQLMLQPIDKTELQACLQSIARGEGQQAHEEQPYQAANRAAATNLLQLTTNSANLEEFLCTPFYFNAALRVLNRPGDGSISFVHDKEHTRQKLEALYINRTIAESKNKAYPPEKMRRCLGWLAHWQSERERMSFEVTDFQPSELEKGKRYSKANGFLFGLGNGLIIGSVFGFVYGLIFPFLGYLLNRPIILKEITLRQWRWRDLVRMQTFFLFFIVSIVASIIGYLINGLIFGLVYGLNIGFLVALIYHLSDYLTSFYYFIELKKPYQRLFSGLKVVGLIWLFAITLTLSFPLIKHFWGYKSLFILFLGSFLFMSTLLRLLSIIRNIVSYFLLNYFFSCENKLPFRMARFFDYCAKELHLLEKDTGGSWRFRHQIIQDYFLEQYRSIQV